MSTLPDYLLNKPHLLLKESDMLNEVVTLVKSSYGFTLDKNNYVNSQAYRGSDGYLKYDLLNIDNELMTTFINQASLTNVVQEAPDPLVINFGAIDDGSEWLSKQIDIPSLEILGDLNNVSDGHVFDGMTSFGDYGYVLSTLLNQYSENAVWAASSFADYSTAKFTKVYTGKQSEAPSNLHLPNLDTSCMVINIQGGKHQGLVCFLAMQ